jgi:non-ribosomal peptide synthetase component F
LEQLAGQRSSTLANICLAVVSWWLYLWTRQDDFCIGVSVAGRNRPDIENLLGFFVNLLAIRMRFSKDKEFDRLLDEIQHAFSEAFDRQHYPFDRLVQVLNPQRLANRQPLVNVVYAFQNFADVRIDVTRGEAPSAAGLVRVSDFDVSFPTAKFDLTFFLAREPDGLRITIEYDTGLFRAQTIQRNLSRIHRLFDSIASEAVP